MQPPITSPCPGAITPVAPCRRDTGWWRWGPYRSATWGIGKGTEKKWKLKRKELIRILPRPQWLCFRRPDTTRSLMPFLRGRWKAVGFWRCSGAFLVLCRCKSELELRLVPAQPAMSPCTQRLSPAELCSHRRKATSQQSRDLG